MPTYWTYCKPVASTFDFTLGFIQVLYCPAFSTIWDMRICSTQRLSFVLLTFLGPMLPMGLTRALVHHHFAVTSWYCAALHTAIFHLTEQILQQYTPRAPTLNQIWICSPLSFKNRDTSKPVSSKEAIIWTTNCCALGLQEQNWRRK